MGCTVFDAPGYIHALGRFSGAPGLHRIRALLAALGEPQKSLHFIHIAGTNGKGSTAAMTAQILQEAGYRAGLFTSPYLVDFCERIQINGVWIPMAALCRLTERVRAAAETLTLPAGETIGEFEFVTAVGMLYFAQESCDVVVLETGLGGRFDATNVIDAPLVTVLTAISLDHTAVLGDTPEQIAREKAGIIKRGSIVVCAQQRYERARQVVESACQDKDVPYLPPTEVQIEQCDLSGTVLCVDDTTYHISMLGKYQVDNTATVLSIVQALAMRGIVLPERAVQDGLRKARLPGRMEKLQEAPLVLLDGAHNPDGVRTLCETIDALLAGRRLLVVLGMMRDKAVAACVRPLAERAACIFCATPENERALPSSEQAALVRRERAEAVDCKTAARALWKALDAARPTDCVLCCGSLYLVGEIKRIWSGRQNFTE